jgi:hypothetical protein
MGDKPKIVVTVYGGVVNDVYCDIDADVAVLDFDNEEIGEPTEAGWVDSTPWHAMDAEVAEILKKEGWPTC